MLESFSITAYPFIQFLYARYENTDVLWHGAVRPFICLSVGLYVHKHSCTRHDSGTVQDIIMQIHIIGVCSRSGQRIAYKNNCSPFLHVVSKSQ